MVSFPPESWDCRNETLPALRGCERGSALSSEGRATPLFVVEHSMVPGSPRGGWITSALIAGNGILPAIRDF
jgi:hypothetical protein